MAAGDGLSGSDEEERGRFATEPREITRRGWVEVLKRTKAESKQDNLILLAAGVAFFALLALVPALVALVSVYGLLADPADVERQVTEAMATAPAEARELVEQQMSAVADQPRQGLGVALAFSVLLAMWSASSGMKHLIAAINAAYDEEETRGFVALRVRALLLTVGAIAFAAAAVALLTVSPGGIVVAIVRFPVIGIGLMAGLAVLYRYAPNRNEPRWSWTAPGTIVATVGSLVGSLLFSLYTAAMGSYAETYGALGAVVVLMLWLLLTAAMIVLGAEINAEAERQTVEDSTDGPPRPMGQREAYAADTVAD